MTVLNDSAIIAAQRDSALITPFKPYHVQPASYDVTLSANFRRLNSNRTGIVRLDSPQIDWMLFYGEYITIYPGEFMLASTEERIALPDYLCAQVTGRSSFGRLGLFVECAGWIDPGFQGQITLELFNASQRPILLDAGIRIAQIVFFLMVGPAERPYGSLGRDSKYQNQGAAVLSQIHQEIQQGEG